MNVTRRPMLVVNYVFRLWLTARRFLWKQSCHVIGAPNAPESPRIEKVYVINLDREPGRWMNMGKELKHILTVSGAQISALTERYAAVDANTLSAELPKDGDIDPFYTLGDQLFVEPQPLA